jgi:multiple sugar transport system permease protein
MTSAISATRTKLIRTSLLGLLRYGLVILLAVMFIIPLYWMILTSFKTSGEAYLFPPSWFPHPFSLEGYQAIWGGIIPFNLFIVNSVIITSLSVIGTVASSTVVAYAFARLKWWGRDVWFVILLATMMLPYEVVMIPIYIIFRKLGWLDTFLPLIVPNFLGNAFYIFLIRQFFLGFPKELEDAAHVDGANSLRILWQIILPNSKPVLLTVALFSFIGSWNDFLGPLIYLHKMEQMTVAVGLSMFAGFRSPNWTAIMAGATISLLPIMLAFIIFQRYFVKGIVLTGIKG